MGNGKCAMAHEIQVTIGLCSIGTIIMVGKLFAWIKEYTISVKVEDNDNQ